MILSVGACKSKKDSGGNPDLAPPAHAKNSAIAYLPPKPKVNGDQLTATNLVVEPVQVGTQQIVHLTVDPDDRADFLQLSICQDISTDPVCIPSPDNADVFIATELYYPTAPIGRSFVQVRACVKPENAIDIDKVCGAWTKAPYYMGKENPVDAWQEAISKIYTGLQSYLVPCTAVQNQVAAYLKANPEVAAGTDNNSIMLQDSLNAGEFTCAQMLQNGLLTQLDNPADPPTKADEPPTGGQSSDTNSKTEVTPVPAPTITSISPESGSAAGGTKITLVGSAFHTEATVHIGSKLCLDLTVKNDTTMTCNTPSGSADAVTVTVTVTNPDTQSASSSFTYTAILTEDGGGDPPTPTISKISPTSGPLTGNGTLTITGTNFVVGAKVAIGTNTNLTSEINTDGTELTVDIPDATAANAATVIVTNPDGTSATSATPFTYQTSGGGTDQAALDFGISMIIVGVIIAALSTMGGIYNRVTIRTVHETLIPEVTYSIPLELDADPRLQEQEYLKRKLENLNKQQDLLKKALLKPQPIPPKKPQIPTQIQLDINLELKTLGDELYTKDRIQNIGGDKNFTEQQIKDAHEKYFRDQLQKVYNRMASEPKKAFIDAFFREIGPKLGAGDEMELRRELQNKEGEAYKRVKTAAESYFDNQTKLKAETTNYETAMAKYEQELYAYTEKKSSFEQKNAKNTSGLGKVTRMIPEVQAKLTEVSQSIATKPRPSGGTVEIRGSGKLSTVKKLPTPTERIKGAGKGAVLGAIIGVAMIAVGVWSTATALAGAAPDPAFSALQRAGQEAYAQALDIALGVNQATLDLIDLQLEQLKGQ